MKRLSIICGDMGDLSKPALEYLILNLNTRQSDIEFQLINYDSSNLFLQSLSPDCIVDYNKFSIEINDFVEVINKTLEKQSNKYDRRNENLGRILFISLAKLKNNYIHTWAPAYSAIFLGDWDSKMSPPSILESILSFIIMEGIYTLLEDPTKISHLPTRGCIGDFNRTLSDVRYKILQGFICNDCRAIINNEEVVDRWTKLLNKKWLGNLSEEDSPANIVSKLGFNLFVTKGLSPTFSEKLITIIKEDGSKELIKILGAILLAMILIWMGLKD